MYNIEKTNIVSNTDRLLYNIMELLKERGIEGDCKTFDVNTQVTDEKSLDVDNMDRKQLIELAKKNNILNCTKMNTANLKKKVKEVI